MNFNDFERAVLKSAYRAEAVGKYELSIQALISKYNLQPQPGWGASAMASLVGEGFVKSGYGEVGPETEMVVALTSLGRKQAEAWIDADRKRTILEKLQSVQRTEWIAFGALAVSILAFFKD